mmetsp:Transcript_10670/g.22644  ORF Transcript_10670/g.22644 Transcript_10670/m.22644 type:complete len:307 (-) Transcript_10670:509-1429(-)
MACQQQQQKQRELARLAAVVVVGVFGACAVAVALCVGAFCFRRFWLGFVFFPGAFADVAVVCVLGGDLSPRVAQRDDSIQHEPLLSAIQVWTKVPNPLKLKLHRHLIGRIEIIIATACRGVSARVCHGLLYDARQLLQRVVIQIIQKLARGASRRRRREQPVVHAHRRVRRVRATQPLNNALHPLHPFRRVASARVGQVRAPQLFHNVFAVISVFVKHNLVALDHIREFESHASSRRQPEVLWRRLEREIRVINKQLAAKRHLPRAHFRSLRVHRHFKNLGLSVRPVGDHDLNRLHRCKRARRTEL